jgi:hypothetical protein
MLIRKDRAGVLAVDGLEVVEAVVVEVRDLVGVEVGVVEWYRGREDGWVGLMMLGALSAGAVAEETV